MRKSLLTFMAALAMSSFAVPARAGDSQVFGTGLGAALGGLLGSQFGHGSGRLAATAAGVFFGGLIGNDIGRSIDRADARYARPGYYNGYSYGMYSDPPPASYRTAYAPNYVAPPDAYAYPDYCREYIEPIRVGNHIEESRGTACLRPDGSWRIVR